MAEMNPYNFVRLRPMAEEARQSPLSHAVYVEQHGREAVYSGHLACTLTAFSPIMLLSYNQEEGDHSVDSDGHKRFHRFFHYPESNRPVIPGTALKGMIRSVAEAASNSCMAIFKDQDAIYEKRWPDFAYSYPPSLLFCGRVDGDEERSQAQVKQFCPTCRIFGSAPEGSDAGSREIGSYPHAFQGKVRVGDAIYAGDFGSDLYLPMGKPLIPLLEPKVSEKVWYKDPQRNVAGYSLAGRKFYYHHDDLQPKTSDKANRFNSTVTPLRPGAVFRFQVGFRNLLHSELALLLYSLELEPAQPLIVVEEDTLRFDWQHVVDHRGVYHKLGYGKAAGLGSCAILVDGLTLLQPTARYGGGVPGLMALPLNEVRQNVMAIKTEFPHSQLITAGGKRAFPPYLADLRNILRFPNDMGTLRYPTLPEFGQYKEAGEKLPLPGDEQMWIAR